MLLVLVSVMARSGIGLRISSIAGPTIAEIWSITRRLLKAVGLANVFFLVLGLGTPSSSSVGGAADGAPRKRSTIDQIVTATTTVLAGTRAPCA